MNDSITALFVGFPEPSQFGEAVPYGYQLCVKLLGKSMAMIGDDTVLALASSMGR